MSGCWLYMLLVCVLVTGRGRLYHWGPNHAGDPVVTRYVYFCC